MVTRCRLNSGVQILDFSYHGAGARWKYGMDQNMVSTHIHKHMGATWHHPKTKTSMDNQTRLRVGRQTANQVGIVTWYITSEQCIILYLADPSINFNFATTYYICYQKTLNICMHGIKLKKKAHGEGPEHAVTIPLLWQGGKSSGYEGELWRGCEGCGTSLA